MTSKARKFYDQGFSQRANHIAYDRMTSKNGKIDQRLGKRGPFTEDFKKVIRSNYLGIYEQPYLDRELKGAKMILRALQSDEHNPDAQDLFCRMRDYPVERRAPCVLCPIWRHECATETLVALALRYFFEAVRRELFFTTIVFGYAANLFQLEQLINQTRGEIQNVQRAMSSKRNGLVMTGALEPDLRAADEFASKPLLRTLAKEERWDVADHGGWVLSGHFLVRAPHHGVLRELMHETWPSSSSKRVQMKLLRRNRSIEDSILAAASYVFKFAGLVFERSGPLRSKSGSASTFRSVQNAFYGPTVDKYNPVPRSFDRDAALVQWALFVDRIGYEGLGYSVETGYAQKWFSETEMEYFKRAGDDAWVHGWHKIELHRDVGPYYNSVDPARKRFVTRRRTRPLTIDHEWYRRTDASNVDPFNNSFPMML